MEELEEDELQGFTSNLLNSLRLPGSVLQKKIPPTKKIFTDYMKTPNLENFTIGLTSADKISDLICSPGSSKSVSPWSIPTKILKIAREIVSLPLSQLINNSISKGIFHNICKVAQVQFQITLQQLQTNLGSFKHKQNF